MIAPPRLLPAVVLIAAFGLTGCGGASSVRSAAPPLAVVEHIAGSPLPRLVLSAIAVQRIGIETGLVQAAPAPAHAGRGGHGHKRPGGNSDMAVVPYPAVFYDADGNAFVYTNPAPRVFVRTRLTIDHITEEQAFTTTGPPVGSRVVTTGAEELLGVEDGVQSE